ncbi:MAG: chromosome segregation protein SMC, partial [Clostridiales bacterium]|nr:chromosome segregation protein SMC [Clostridiales bacterium]
MKFKKLSLIGFKSFANKLEIRFGEGITGIVGPNGCGKSNVADAVRWVLGEQSSKLLRGTNMQDVIFSGTKKRKSLSYAEVSLTFDNSGRSLFPSYTFEEVVITRKLFRSGESEYYINGSECRLRDISELLRDGGFAREGYTIIGQGRVTELINSKPEDRRAIFEEAAGIAKYKYKKIEAERKNERTRANLDRINDAMDGDAQRLGPLTKQAEKARQYFDLKEKLKYHEINYYIHNYESSADVKDKLAAVVADYEAQIKAKQAEYEKATEAYNAAQSKLLSIDSDIEALHAEMLSLSVDKEKLTGKIGMLTLQIQNIGKENETLIASNATLSQNYNELTRAAEQKQAELDKKADELREAKAQYDKLNGDFSALVDKVAKEEEKIESARRALMDAMERKAAVNLSIGELTAERASVNEHIESRSSRVAHYSEQIASNAVELGDVDEELKSLASDKEKLIAEKDQKSERSVKCAEELHAAVEGFEETKRLLSVEMQTKKMLADMVSAMEGYAAPVRKLLADAKSNPKIEAAIMGVVGRIIKVKDGFETALETALGSAVSNIVTKNEEDAKFLVEVLKANRYGRATFLPVTSFRSREIEREYLSLLSRPGCFGVATEAVSVDPAFDSVIKGLLGGTVVVDNMDTAISLAKSSNYAFRIVTLDGDMVYPQGSITGGSKKADTQNVFSHERELNESTEKVEKLQRALDELKAKRDKLTAENDSLLKSIKALTEDIHEYELIEAQKTAERTRLDAERDGLETALADDKSALDVFLARLDSLSADIDAVSKTNDELETGKRSEEEQTKQREFEAMRSERDRCRELLSSKNLELVTLEKDCETLKTEIARLKAEAVATAQSIENNDMAILGNNRTMQERNAELRALSDSTGEGADSRRKEIADKLDGLGKYKADLNNTVVESDRCRVECADAITHLTEAKHEQELQLTRVDSDMEAMQQRITEEYELDYTHCLEYKDEGYDAEAGAIEIAKLRRRIVNLGSINETAIEES